jgi:hypothetical protein
MASISILADGPRGQNDGATESKGVSMRSRAVAAMAVIWTLWAHPALGWGGDGHRIIGHIAFERLTERARAQVAALLGPDDTLANACAWADEVARRDRRYTFARPLHFIDIDPDATVVALDQESCPTAGDGSRQCIVAAIRQFTERLADTRLLTEERLVALRFLAHFVGDLHQPLHVSHPDGRGGNTVYVWTQGRRIRLHTLWDSGFVEADERERAERAGEGDPRAWQPLAAVLARDVSAIDVRLAARAVGAPTAADLGAASERAALTWATESLAISKNERLFRPKQEASVLAPEIDEATLLAERQLRVAGVRLAALLNAVFP